MAVLKNVRTDATQRDTSIDLKTFLSANYTLSSPAAASINFDTKFERLNKPNHIIVERMPRLIKPEVLGAGRFRYEDVKRIQIICTGQSALNNRYLIEEHLDDIVNANPTGMQATYGIDELLLTNFTTIRVVTEDQLNHVQAIPTETARSFAECHMWYSKYKV